jgi:hypothetical protein
MAGDGLWKQFDKDWITEVLHKREPHAPYLHMSQLLTGNGPFRGWEQDRRYNLVMDAVDYLQNLPKKAFCAVVCSIDETARNRLIADGCTITEPHVICAQCCIGQAFQWYYDTHPDRIEAAYIHFDQNEKFMHPIRQRWQQENKGQRLVIANTFWGLIVDISDLDMRNTSALQAADLLAWATSRRHSAEERPFLYLAEILEKVVPHSRLLLDEQVLREKHAPKRPDKE